MPYFGEILGATSPAWCSDCSYGFKNYGFCQNSDCLYIKSKWWKLQNTSRISLDYSNNLSVNQGEGTWNCFIIFPSWSKEFGAFIVLSCYSKGKG